MMENYIAYYRVSTTRQGQSGLGLEAQQEAIRSYLAYNQGRLVDSYTEIETGTKDDRQELQRALEMCKRYDATLLIAKIDRLSRKVSFISALMDAKTKFIACDNPSANNLTIHILSAMAEHERQMISLRTKEALDRVKASGRKLGNPKNLSNQDVGRSRGLKVSKSRANEFSMSVYILIKPLQDQGASLNAIAKEFNRDGLLSARGKKGSWTARSVKNIIKRVEGLE
jgi:DNA invertase Pin-like site-specific DNA recombinase